MPVRVIMPSLGQTTDEITIIRWLKKKGDVVAKGEPLLEIQTDKAVMEVESIDSGTVLEMMAEEGQTVLAGDTIAYLGQPGEQIPQAGSKDVNPAITDQSLPCDMGSPGPVNPSGTARLDATPAARALAKEHGVVLADIPFRSPDGVIRKEDVEAWIAAKKPHSDKTPSALAGEGQVVQLTPMRRRIAQRMHESKQVAPHFYVTARVDMSNAMAIRRAVNAKSGVRVAYHDILVRAIVAAVSDFPEINSTLIDADHLRVNKAVNVGLAVKLNEGLIVPVLKDTQAKSLLETARDSAELIERARSGRLRPDDLVGGTITLSNLGMYNISSFAAIINQPESAILAVGQATEEAVVENGAVVIRPIMTVTLSVDHRVIDGATAAGFLSEFKRVLETPYAMVID